MNHIKKLFAVLTSLIITATCHAQTTAKTNDIPRFFEEHMRSVAWSTNLPFETLGMPDVQERYIKTMNKLAIKYDGIEISLMEIYGKDTNACVGSAVENGKPIIEVYVPASMNVYKQYATCGANQEYLFQCFLAVDLNRELERVCSGKKLKSAGKMSSKEFCDVWVRMGQTNSAEWKKFVCSIK